MKKLLIILIMYGALFITEITDNYLRYFSTSLEPPRAVPKSPILCEFVCTSLPKKHVFNNGSKNFCRYDGCALK